MATTTSSAPCVRVGNFLMFPQVLGKGSNAEVRLGMHAETKKTVAIKVFNITRKSEFNFGRFLGEISPELRILQQLRGTPNTIQLLDVIVINGQEIYEVFEFVQGLNLLEFFTRRGRNLNEGEAKALFLELSLMVLRLHKEHNVAHLDIKMENIMFDELTKQLVLVDFGFAAEFDSNNPIGLTNRRGSPQYCSPEIYFNQKCYDGRAADVYSLGVLLYVLLMGKFPFDSRTETGAENISGIFSRKRHCVYGALPSHFSSELKDLFHHILQPNPSARITLPQIISHRWFSSQFVSPG